MGRLPDGIRELEQALSMKAGDGSAQLNLALAYEQSGHAAKALPLFAKVEATAGSEKRPLAASILQPYGRALAAAGLLDAATAKMKQAALRDPKNAEIEDDLGSLYAHRQDWADAREAFEAALKLQPVYAMAHLHLGLALKELQQPGAMEELARANQLAPENPVIAVEYANALSGVGQDEQAIAVLDRALKATPGSIVAAYPLGLAMQRVGRAEEAIPLLQKVADARPADGDVLTNLGMALCQVQRPRMRCRFCNAQSRFLRRTDGASEPCGRVHSNESA